MIEGQIMPEDVRRQLRDRLRILPKDGDARIGALRLRTLLEELGIRCDETAALEDLEAALIASSRGMEALIAARLDDEQRHNVYARLVARLLVGELRPPIDARLEYADIHKTASTREREEDAVVFGLARALVDGRLDAAPRPLYEDVPKLTLAFTPRSAARSTLGGFHQWSVLWYKRSNMYRRWRSRRDVSEIIGRVCAALERGSVVALAH